MVGAGRHVQRVGRSAPGEVTRTGVIPYVTGAVTALVCIAFFAWPPSHG